MAKYRVYGIEYDLEDAFGEMDADELNLPDELVVEAEDEDDAIDAVSDLTGWCVLRVEGIEPDDGLITARII